MILCIWQLVLLTSVLIVTFKLLFFTDCVIKKASIGMRTIGMFLSIILMMVLCIFLFDWFPVNQWQPWIMFFLCFGVSAAVSTFVSVIYEKMENQKMDEALQKLKQG